MEEVHTMYSTKTEAEKNCEYLKKLLKLNEERIAELTLVKANYIFIYKLFKICKGEGVPEKKGYFG